MVLGARWEDIHQKVDIIAGRARVEEFIGPCAEQGELRVSRLT
jgi:hypothetical protein